MFWGRLWCGGLKSRTFNELSTVDLARCDFYSDDVTLVYRVSVFVMHICRNERGRLQWIRLAV